MVEENDSSDFQSEDELFHSETEQEAFDSHAGDETDDALEKGNEGEQSETDTLYDENNQEYVKALNKKKLEKFNAKHDNSGVIYLSRVPPHMQPHKVKQLLKNMVKLEEYTWQLKQKRSLKIECVEEVLKENNLRKAGLSFCPKRLLKWLLRI